MLMQSHSDICCGIVTYGERFEYLALSINSAIDAGIRNFVIVLNGNTNVDEVALAACFERCDAGFKLIKNEKNKGSAGGFLKVVRTYLEFFSGCQQLLLLDDDNILPSDFDCRIRNLMLGRAWLSTDSFVFYRVDRMAYRSIVDSNGEIFPFGVNGTYAGFDLFRPRNSRARKINCDDEPILIPYACYGGLFLARRVVELIGLPDDKLFLYGDDHEWTYRITAKGFNLYLCPTIVVRDAEISWSERCKSNSFAKYFSAKNFTHVLYTIRNRLSFEVNKLDGGRSLKRFVNFLVFNLFLFIYGWRSPKRLCLILKVQARLGKAGKLYDVIDGYE